MKGRDPGRLRLDLYLKRTGLVKRRTLAATMCDNGYVAVNGRSAGPGKAVKPGDRIQVRYARKKLLVEVTGIPERGRKDRECHRILSEEAVVEEWF